MRRHEAIAALRAHETELRDAGVLGVALFGSVARDEAGPDSDVDVSVRIDTTRLSSGFAWFETVDRLGRRLEAILGARVDLVVEPIRKERLREAVEKDRRVAF